MAPEYVEVYLRQETEWTKILRTDSVQQEDDIHPSIAGFPSHYRKVRFSDI